MKPLRRLIMALAESPTRSYWVSFLGGLQVALGASVLISIAGRGTTGALIAVLFMTGFSFLLGAAMSMSIAWALTEIRQGVEHVRLTILSSADVVNQKLQEKSRFMGWPVTRLQRCAIFLALDLLLSSAAIVLFVGSVVWW